MRDGDVGDHSNNFSAYMSDAHRPAVDVQMAAQDACVPLSFWLILSAILIDGDGYTVGFNHVLVRYPSITY